MRVLFFGDSITQGYWDVEGGWVERIRKHYDTLQVQDLERRDEPTIFNLGVSADTSRDVLGRIERETTVRTSQSEKPVTVIQIGLNDSLLEDTKAMTTGGEYRKNLEAIVDVVSPIAKKLIFVGSSACDEVQTNPVFWGDHYWTNQRIKKYESIMSSVAEQRNVTFIPVFDSFKAALDEGKDLLSDGLHPNSAGHQLIADIVRPKLEELLV